MKRLFIGLPVSEEVRRGAGALVAKLWRPGVKWVQPENFHVTLRFLGSVPDADVAGWVARLQAAARRPAFDVSFGAVESKKTVIWVKIDEGAAQLTELARALGEEGDYRPHLTLGRPKGRVRTGGALGLRQRADRLVLYESKTLPAGPVYTALAEAPLL